jgi:hypothetical protein
VDRLSGIESIFNSGRRTLGRVDEGSVNLLYGAQMQSIGRQYHRSCSIVEGLNVNISGGVLVSTEKYSYRRK